MKTNLLTLILVSLGFLTFAQTGTITNITVQPRSDGSGMLDVHFENSCATYSFNVLLRMSFDCGFI